MFHGLKRLINSSVLMTSLVGVCALAAPEADIDLDSIESEMSRRGEEQANQTAPSETERRSEDNKPVTFQELPKLSNFSDISIIQKKFLPKSYRFQLYGGLNFLTNNPFFDTYGVNARLNFFFTETIGLELNYWRHKVSDRLVTSDLSSKYNITTKTMLSSNGYMGASLLFVPFYGKMTFMDKRIIPYDLYVSVGGGVTETSYIDKAAPSVHLGAGEIFALSKSLAWRWDFSNVQYTAKVPEVSTTGALNDTGKKRTISDLYLGIGVLILFPGATYR
ncbi:MAG: hypothetical protein RJB66_2069 [Pseudomonadota bacterium]|jgi:outer membrane beta-barrel protein